MSKIRLENINYFKDRKVIMVELGSTTYMVFNKNRRIAMILI